MNERYVGHQRHIKAQINQRVFKRNQELEEQGLALRQYQALLIELCKLLDKEIPESLRGMIVHHSFREVAEKILWHMPSNKHAEMFELLDDLGPIDMWSKWIWPRVHAVRDLEKYGRGLVTRPAAKLPMFWDDQIQIRSCKEAGFPTSGWYEIMLNDPKVQVPVETETKPEPEPEPEPVLKPTDPVFTSHPVPRPWWASLLKYRPRR